MEEIEEGQPKKQPAITINIQSWATPVVGNAIAPYVRGHVMQTGHTGQACIDRIWLDK